MGRFSKEKVMSISLSIYSINELEDFIVKAAKLIEEKYSINTISDFRCNYSYGIMQEEPMVTIEFTKNIM